MSDLEEALKSMKDGIAFSARDWSLNHRDAWLYGLVVGWDDESLAELTEKHHWEPKTVERLKRLNAAVQEARDDGPPEPLYCLACQCSTVSSNSEGWKSCHCSCHGPEQR